MPDNNPQRKRRVVINPSIFDQIKRLYKQKSKEEMLEITSLSKSALNAAIRKIESFENDNPTFEALYKRAGRNKGNRDSLHAEIRTVFGNNNSFTQVGCRELLQNSSISLATMCRAVKEANLTRKRLKRRANIVLSEEHKATRQVFCSRILGSRSRQILFLDESGFNLHTSINYGYSPVGQDAFIYQPRSRGKNISLCAIISMNGIEHFNLVDGACTKEIFLGFLEECFRKGIFQNNPVLVMDNVRFHCGEEIKHFLLARGVQVMMLPTYSPDLNPIENIFGCIKARLDRIRPRAETREMLNNNIRIIIQGMGSCEEYYRSFWQLVNAINNRQEE